jgi:hypothetical protein
MQPRWEKAKKILSTDHFALKKTSEKPTAACAFWFALVRHFRERLECIGVTEALMH